MEADDLDKTPPGQPVKEAKLAEPKRKSNWRSLLSSLSIIILAPVAAILLTSFVFQPYEVQGSSMENTLSDRDRLIIWKLPATVSKITANPYIPDRYDIVVFQQQGLRNPNDQSKQLIKRVIGIPGDRIVINNDKFTIYNKQNPQGFNPDSGQEFSPGVIQPTRGNIDLTVADGEVFVSGDNRTDSYDSREFGTVPAKALIGKLVLRIIPVSKFDSF